MFNLTGILVRHNNYNNYFNMLKLMFKCTCIFQNEYFEMITIIANIRGNYLETPCLVMGGAKLYYLNNDNNKICITSNYSYWTYVYIFLIYIYLKLLNI